MSINYSLNYFHQEPHHLYFQHSHRIARANLHSTPPTIPAKNNENPIKLSTLLGKILLIVHIIPILPSMRDTIEDTTLSDIFDTVTSEYSEWTFCITDGASSSERSGGAYIIDANVHNFATRHQIPILLTRNSWLYGYINALSTLQCITLISS